MKNPPDYSRFCTRYHKAVELLGRRWTGAIVRELLHGAVRFNEIRDAIPDLSDRMLSERLKELEAEGIVTRIVHPETPVRIEYRLTRKGQDLERVVDAIKGWAYEWLPFQPPGAEPEGSPDAEPEGSPRSEVG